MQAIVTIINFISSILSAMVFQKLWQWFIIPWIEKAPSLPFAIAFGIILIIRFLTYQVTGSDAALILENEKDKQNKIFMVVSGTHLVIIISTFIVGWIFHFFV